MARKHPSDPTSDAAFESHLSTVTKLGLGMLILITMASTFSSSLTIAQPKFAHNFRLPLMKLASPDAKGVSFECRNGRCFPVQLTELIPIYREFFDAYEMNQDMDRVAREFNNRNIQHEYFTLDFRAHCGEEEFPDEPAIRCLPKSDTQGETLEELVKEGSVFRKRLETINKEVDVVHLNVWPDSFQFFRDLREWLTKEGYQIGWFPQNRPIVLPRPERLGDGRHWVN
jgi:hypothetical protein